VRDREVIKKGQKLGGCADPKPIEVIAKWPTPDLYIWKCRSFDSVHWFLAAGNAGRVGPEHLPEPMGVDRAVLNLRVWRQRFYWQG